MIRKIIFCSAIIFSAGLPYSVSAQQPQQAEGGSYAPIFITPYEQQKNTYKNNVPTMVQADPSRQSRNVVQQAGSNYGLNSSRYQNNYDFKPVGNPYEGTGYGRIKGEKEYFDTASGRYMGQYDYMRALASRGDMAELSQVRAYLQERGTFDPKKYQAAMTGGGEGQNGDTTNNGNAGTTGSSQSVDGASIINRSKAKVQDKDSLAMPQKLHQGYDDEPAPYKKNTPIFLR